MLANIAAGTSHSAAEIVLNDKAIFEQTELRNAANATSPGTLSIIAGSTTFTNEQIKFIDFKTIIL